MLRKKVLFAVTLGLLGVLMAVATQAAQSSFEEDTVVWTLKQTKVTDPGQTVIVPTDPVTGFPGGTLTTGYTLEARARTKSGKLVPEGTFRLTLSAFRPNADMPAQKAGMWHVKGQWTIVDKFADKQALKVRHNPYVVKGKIYTVLPFDPANGEGHWSAGVTVPMAPAAGQWAQGSKGSLTFDAKLEGDLFLVLKLWPANQ